MKSVVTFGEIMLRLKSPGFERLMQSPALEATFGGGEANVAVSLANYGLPVRYVTVLPDNDLAAACIRQLRGFGIDTSCVQYGPGRMGLYYLETGACQRPSKVIYDREYSAISQAGLGAIDWDRAFEGAGWLHISGTTPAVSEGAAALTLQAVRAAKAKGIHVSCDLNYRKKLWQWGRPCTEVMSEICEHADTLIANEEDIQMSLGIGAATAHAVESGELDSDQYRKLAEMVMARYPGMQRVCITLRQSRSADHNDWAACLYDGSDFLLSRTYSMLDIVDRVGGGDSFSAGIISGTMNLKDEAEALDFAVAASCLKHTIPGDFNRVSLEEVKALMAGSGSGRVQR